MQCECCWEAIQSSCTFQHPSFLYTIPGGLYKTGYPSHTSTYLSLLKKARGCKKADNRTLFPVSPLIIRTDLLTIAFHLLWRRLHFSLINTSLSYCIEACHTPSNTPPSQIQSLGAAGKPFIHHRASNAPFSLIQSRGIEG